jgi:uncharacterized protein Yka (UPF0111/DUF47 family)
LLARAQENQSHGDPILDRTCAPRINNDINASPEGILNVLTEEIIRIEGQSDELHDRGRRDLFLSERNAIAFMIGTEVYDHLEQVVDRFEDVANEINAIVIENV